MYKLLIVDDEPLVQVGIKSMLNYEKLNIELCGIAGNGEAALKIIEEQMPDIVISDIKMPIMSGLELIKHCVEKYGYKKPVFIFLTSFEEFQMAKEALTYQASDYLVKLELTPDLLEGAILKAIENLPKDEASTGGQEENLGVNGEERFLIRLLENMYETKEQIELQSKYYKVSLNAKFYQCAYIEFFEHVGTELSSEKQFALLVSSYNLLNELIRKYMNVKMVSLDLKHCAVIMEVSEKASESGDGKTVYTPSEESIVQCYKELNDALSKYYNTTFKVGIGTVVNSPEEIAASYQYARQAYSNMPEDCNVFSIEDCTNADMTHQIFNLSIFKTYITQAFDEYDVEKLHSIINLLSEMFLSNTNRYFQALDAACSILYIAISSIPNGEKTMEEIFADYPDFYRSIYKQRTTEQVVAWLHIFEEKMAAYFAEKKNNPTHHIVSMVKKYISENITKRFTLNDVAENFGITPNYLSQLFKKYNDLGFNEYVTAAKINEAKKMMAEGNLKIYEISDALGFDNSLYFSKVFKKLEGISPTEYINQKL